MKSEVLLQTFTHYETDVLGIENPYHRIIMFGHLTNGKVCAVRIEDYKPHMKLELPAGEFGEDLDMWEKNKYENMKKIRDAILNIKTLKTSGHTPCAVHMQYDRRLYMHDENKYPYLEVYFDTEEAMKHATNYLRKFPLKLGKDRIYVTPREENLSTYSTYLKLLDAFDLKQSTWKRCINSIRADGAIIPKVTTEEYEYVVSFENIHELSLDDASKMPIILPSVLSFDWECNAQNPLAMPKWYNRNDVAFMCSVTHVTYDYAKDSRNESPIVNKYLLVYGVCTDIDGTQVIRFDTEIDTIIALRDLIKSLNPTVILSHNGLGFDFIYMHRRLSRKQKDWGVMGRVFGHRANLIGKDWSSSAYKDIVVKYLDMPGRIVLDTMLVAMRKFNNLDAYNLKFVSNYFLENLSKIDLSPQEIFRLYALSTRENLSMDKREASMQEIGIYAVRDADLPYELYKKWGLWLDSIELSNVTYTPISHLYTRGMSCRCMNLIYIYAHQMGFFINDREQEDFDYSGAHVFDPVTGLYGTSLGEDDDILEEQFWRDPDGFLQRIVRCFPCFDFTSLYPSIICHLNICYTTLCNPLDPRNADVSDNDCNIVNCNEKGIVQRVRWYKNKEGILPHILRDLTEARNLVKIQLKKETDPTKRQMLDGRQIALKLSANSVYGFLGFRTGKLKCKEGAMCTTAYGRELIKMVSDYLERKYKGFIIYGDTDSCMCYIPGMPLDNGTIMPITEQNYKNTFETIAKDITKYIDKTPISIAYEKAYRRALMIKKKMYAYIPMEVEVNIQSDGKTVKKMMATTNVDDAKINSKGIILSRRDNCKYLKYGYEIILRDIMCGRSLKFILNDIRRIVSELLSGIDLSMLTVIKSIGSKYKEGTAYPMAVFAQNLVRAGKVVNPGDRLEYVFVCVNNSKEKQGNRMQTLDLFESEGNRIDYLYYLKNAICKPLDKLLTIVVRNEVSNYVYREKYMQQYYDSEKDVQFEKEEERIIVNTSSHTVREIGKKAFHMSSKDGITCKYIQKILIPKINRILKSYSANNKALDIISIDWHKELGVEDAIVPTAIERRMTTERFVDARSILRLRYGFLQPAFTNT